MTSGFYAPDETGLQTHPRYRGFFDLFNRGQYFEAHDVLEVLWLPLRGGPDADFFKGLIQLAGAFVHERKGRIGPALALLRLARSNLSKYPAWSFGINTEAVINQIDSWSSQLGRPGAVQVSARPVLPLPSMSAAS